MIQRALAKLVAIGHDQLYIANRTMSKADSLANVHSNLTVIPFASLKPKLDQFSTIYIGVHTTNYIFSKDDLKYLSNEKTIVDVSLPRSVDPLCENLENINFISVINSSP